MIMKNASLISWLASHHSLFSLLTMLLAGVTPSAHAQSPSVLTDHDAYHSGEIIRVLFKSGPGNRLDWIGVYPDGVEPGLTPSTLWNYVDGTRVGRTGFKEGTVTFPNGLNLDGDWVAYLLLNDGYTKLATNNFKVVDPSSPLVRANKRVYAPDETITITFTNGPANAKDRIVIYPTGQTPDAVGATLWNYVDGTQIGTVGKTDGTIMFTGGLSTPGRWTAHFLLNDGATLLASETFSVEAAAAGSPRVIAVSPSNGATNTPAAPGFSATIQNGSTRIALNSVELKFDGSAVPHQTTDQTNQVTVQYASDAVSPPGSMHTYSLTYADTAGHRFTNEVRFTIAPYRDIQLPPPIHLETFDTTDEGKLPPGWTEKSYSEITNPDFDPGNLDSASYATWTVVNVERFNGSFIPYSNPDASQADKDDYQRVLTPGENVVVDGKQIRQPATGRMLFGNSGYRNGASQALYAFTPDFDLTGQRDVHLAFYSLWEQNQDSFGAVEYSVDSGQTWWPVVYYLHSSDILRTGQGEIDAVATFTAEQSDVARYTDDQGIEVGGTYGAYIAAAISPALSAFIQPRVDDSPTDGKRVELFRLAQTDGKSKVRFRITHTGSDSWYFGIDNFGLYSFPSNAMPSLSVA